MSALSTSKPPSPLSLNPVGDEVDRHSDSDLLSDSDLDSSSDSSDSDSNSYSPVQSKWIATRQSDYIPNLMDHYSQSFHSNAFSKSASKLARAYVLANVARQKLSGEVDRPNRSLRVLVGHANLLDAVVDDIRQTELQQASWFDRYAFLNLSETVSQSPSPLALPPSYQVEIDDSQVVDSAPEDDSPPGSAFSFDDEESASTASSQSVTQTVMTVEDEYYDEDAEDADLALCRTVSKSPTQSHHTLDRSTCESPPPGLIDDTEAEYAADEDEDTDEDDERGRVDVMVSIGLELDRADERVDVVDDDEQPDGLDSDSPTSVKSPTSPASPSDGSLSIGSVLWSRRRT